MGFIERLKEKFHHDKGNENRMMTTENNQEKFGLSSKNERPRNNMMDTISNEQGAKELGSKNNLDLQYDEEVKNKNLLTHSISNEQAQELSNGINIQNDNSSPRNKLLDLTSNEEFKNDTATSAPMEKVNSDRLL